MTVRSKANLKESTSVQALDLTPVIHWMLAICRIIIFLGFSLFPGPRIDLRRVLKRHAYEWRGETRVWVAPTCRSTPVRRAFLLLGPCGQQRVFMADQGVSVVRNVIWRCEM